MALSGTPTALSPPTNYTITATNSYGSDSISIEISVIQGPPVILYAPTSHTFYENVTISLHPHISQGMGLVWTVSPALPSGLSINSSTGVISGTPNSLSSPQQYTVTATNSIGSDQATLTIQVIQSVPPPSINYNPSNFILTRGVPMTEVLPSTNNTTIYSWEVYPALPSGLNLNQTNGAISGTPQVNLTQTTFGIIANGNGVASFSIQITINEPPAVISYYPSTPQNVYTFGDFGFHNTGNFQHYTDCDLNSYYYNVTSDMTLCNGIHQDWIAYNGIASQSGPEENGGIFSAGTYHYTIFDTAGDGLNGNAAFHFETRAVGSTGAYTTIHSEIGTFIGSSGLSGTITVPSGQEMILAYNCPGTSNCWPTENYMTITPEVIPTIPAAAVGVGGAAPTGSEPADVTFYVSNGQEAYLTFITGNSPGDADETEIYFRIAGSTAWIDKWDICSISDSSCNSATTYDSHLANPPILFQTPATYELLVWDTAGMALVLVLAAQSYTQV